MFAFCYSRSYGISIPRIPKKLHLVTKSLPKVATPPVKMGVLIETKGMCLMSWFVAMEIFWILLEWVRLGRKSRQDKDLEILLLRHQLAILERKQDKVVRASRAEKLILTVLAMKLKARRSCTI